MEPYVLAFSEIDKAKASLVGGKGANLGELATIEGIHVPDGFCVTTASYEEALGNNAPLGALLGQLASLGAEDVEGAAALSAQIRSAIEEAAIPQAVVDEIGAHLGRLGQDLAYSVRSSATAEDLPGASFAGQQDTFLNVRGEAEILRHISKCWASLFNDRAVAYRVHNGFDHRSVMLCAVVQEMVLPDVAGVMFTADPITSNRKVTAIDASFGLGEALVSGLVTADNYKVRDGQVIAKAISAKEREVRGLEGGGTEVVPIDAARQQAQALSDAQILQLEKAGRMIEAHFGCPQDIEYAIVGEALSILQSRPITTLYPVPETSDGRGHVYLSFGHQQMMTDAMKPMGLSCFRYSGGGDGTLLVEAGGRLFMDLTHDLATAFGRSLAVPAMGAVDPLVKSALNELVKRKAFIKSLAHGKRFLSMGSGYFSWALISQFLKVYRSGNEETVPALMRENEATIKGLEEKFAALEGEELFEAADLELKHLIDIIGAPRGMACVWTGTYAVSWVNKKVAKWLGEKGVGDTLAQSVPNNIVGEMGLDLLDVADAVRSHPAVVDFLKTVKPEGSQAFFDALGQLEGGHDAAAALQGYLAKYGVRCPGEIDVTRARWLEEPAALAPLVLSNIENFAPGGHQEILAQGLKQAEDKRAEILGRIPKGKVWRTDRMIGRIRNFIGYREYPKYVMVWHYWIVKQALLREADKLVACGVFRDREDMFYLSFEELRTAARTKAFDYGLVEKRKNDFAAYEKLEAPRLLTSEGEVITGAYDAKAAPAGALVGIAASSGVVEGRARVVLRLEDAVLSKGDILVTRFTDPSWTAVFVSMSGLVAEVGGAMTHGSVVAREYGLPAVVGVENATSAIKDGQRIRVNGTEGYIEVLDA
ncbi:MAG: phosphoenolpyruvate synthase [Eggerthellaceae bacterium]|nr:phosphoenolpyruvate synthase [Eggerthellaceae bacterium]